MHSNPRKIAAELKVVVPKIEKKKAPVEGEAPSLLGKAWTFEARWRFKSATALYVQIALPVPLMKSYGAAIECPVSSGPIRKALQALPMDGASLAESGTPYAMGSVRKVEAQWLLRVSGVDLWIPIQKAVGEEIDQAMTHMAATHVGEIDEEHAD